MGQSSRNGWEQSITEGTTNTLWKSNYTSHNETVVFALRTLRLERRESKLISLRQQPLLLAFPQRSLPALGLRLYTTVGL